MTTVPERVFATPHDIVRYCVGRDLSIESSSGQYLASVRNLPLYMRKLGSALVLDAQPERRRSTSLIPAIVLDRDTSLVITDLDGTLFAACAGARAKVGPVFQLDWSARDGGGRRYPSWNPLSSDWLHPYGGRRDTQLRLMARHLGRITEADPDAIACLETALQWSVGERAAIKDPIAATMLPAAPAHGRHLEPTLPMVFDWLGQLPSRHRMFLEAAKRLNEIYDAAPGGYNPFRAALTGLSQLARMPQARRQRVIDDARICLGFCAEPGVRERLSAGSFAARELRGLPVAAASAREEAMVVRAQTMKRTYYPRYAPNEMQPMTVFVGSSASAFAATAGLTSLFVEMCSGLLVANRPNALDQRGRQVGPHGVLMHVDAADRLPMIETLTHLPALGPGAQVAITIHADTLTTLSGRYRGLEVEALASCMEAIVVAADAPRDDLQRLTAAHPTVIAGLPADARMIVARTRSHAAKPILAAGASWWTIDPCRTAVWQPAAGTGLAPPPPCPIDGRA